MSLHRTICAILAAALLTGSSLGAQSQQAEAPRSVLEKAAADFQRGKVGEAEQAVRAALRRAPDDPAALGLLGVVLDSQKRYDEAEGAYRRALAASPSPALLNNLGNHYLAQGKAAPARAAYLKVVTVEPRHPNANLQLARLCVAARQGPAAIHYLEHLGPEDQASPPVAILRARALYLSGQQESALALLRDVEKRAGNDSSVSLSIGMAYVDWQRYADAE